MKISEGIDRLIFRWPEKGVSFLLPAFFVLAVLIHASAVFLFQIVYPPVETIAPPQAQVVFIAPTTPENRAFLESLESENPAKVAQMADLTPVGVGRIDYQPTYRSPSTEPKPVGRNDGSVALPPALSPLALLNTRRTVEPAPREAIRTTLSLSETLRERDAARGSPIRLEAQVEGAHPPAVFLIGVDDRGELRYAFLQTGSGSHQLDEAAEKALRTYPFRADPSAPGITWGFATFHWGADVATAAKAIP